MLQSMGSQRVRHDLETEEQQQGGSQNLHMGEVDKHIKLLKAIPDPSKSAPSLMSGSEV